MRAVVYTASGAIPELVEVPAPECPYDGAVVEVRATGVCRSDWHAWKGHDQVPLPNIPGHEFAGVVTQVGRDVASFKAGDRVTVPFVNGCGRCAYCVGGQAQVCPDQTQPGFTHPGSFAELVAVRAADFNLVRLPDDVDFVSAAALGCRFATSFHALTAQAGMAAGEWLVVFGCGGVGLSAVLVARALRARVVAIDPSADARALAKRLGADFTLPAYDPALVAELTQGGAHVSLDAVGSAATAASGVRSLRRRGRHVQVGLMLAEHAEAPLPWGELVAKELSVIGSHGMAAADYPPMLDLITAGRLDPKLLLGRTVGLESAGAELMAMDHPPTTPGVTVVGL